MGGRGLGDRDLAALDVGHQVRRLPFRDVEYPLVPGVGGRREADPPSNLHTGLGNAFDQLVRSVLARRRRPEPMPSRCATSSLVLLP